MREYVLYKFKTINKYLFESLVNGEFYFAPPGLLNDPFDCQVDIAKALDVAVSQAEGSARVHLEGLRAHAKAFRGLQKKLEGVGVCSFSSQSNNTLMWSHYADSHAGVCLKYVIPETYFADNAAEILGIGPVVYGSRPLVDWFAGRGAALEDFDARFQQDLVVRVWTIKDRPWKYEREWRIVRGHVGPHPVDKGFLRQVCFGLKTTEADIRLVRTLALDCGYRVGFRRMVRHEKSDFALAAVPL